MQAAASALLAVLLLAGCTSGPSNHAGLDLPSTTPADPTAPAPQVSATHGAIQGIVTDEELQPVAAARVTLTAARSPTPLQDTSTDAAGVFVFSTLDPGQYLVAATADGHFDASAAVDVAADTIRSVTLTLTLQPGVAPYVSLIVRSGLIHCEASLVASAGNSCPASVVGENTDYLLFAFERGHTLNLLEAQWTPRSTSLLLRFDLTRFDEQGEAVALGQFGNLIGPPTLRKEFRPGDTSTDKPGTLNVAKEFPDGGTRGRVNARVWYAGNYQPEINSTLTPACQALTYCSGVGLGLEQRFDVYMSVFYWFTPTDLASYSAIPDG